MKLWILSDMHADRGIDDIGVDAPDFDVFVCAGDVLTGDVAGSVEMVAAIARGKPSVFVGGNHEWMSAADPREVFEEGKATAARLGVHWLERERVTIDGIKFAGATLWLPEDVRFEAAADYLAKAQADVVVTHFEPSAAVLAAVGTKLWIYGHEHGFSDRHVGATRLVRNAIGYPLTALPADEMPRQDFVVEVAR